MITSSEGLLQLCFLVWRLRRSVCASRGVVGRFGRGRRCFDGWRTLPPPPQVEVTVDVQNLENADPEFLVVRTQRRSPHPRPWRPI